VSNRLAQDESLVKVGLGMWINAEKGIIQSIRTDVLSGLHDLLVRKVRRIVDDVQIIFVEGTVIKRNRLVGNMIGKLRSQWN
jgi:hypothetical protein